MSKLHYCPHCKKLSYEGGAVKPEERFLPGWVDLDHFHGEPVVELDGVYSLDDIRTIAWLLENNPEALKHSPDCPVCTTR